MQLVHASNTTISDQNPVVPRRALPITRAQTHERDPARAVADLAGQLGDAPGLTIFFCAPDFDLPVLAGELARTFPDAVGCTTAGQLGGDGFDHAGICACRLDAARFGTSTHLLSPLDQRQEAAAAIAAKLEHAPPVEGTRSFGLLLVDGLSVAEEHVIAALYQHLGAMPIVGGSAGDNERFVRTAVYHSGAFSSDAAVFITVTTALPFHTFRTHHFTSTGRKLVVTAADAARRIVYEFNGEPAIEAYAEVLGVSTAEVKPALMSKHPVMLRIGDEYYVRSVGSILPNGAMQFFCAIDLGLVLELGEAVDPRKALHTALDEARSHVPNPALMLGFDCTLRWTEFHQDGIAGEIGRLLARNQFVGFSTYGEQCDGLHVNQTLTGVCIGGGP